MNPNVFQSLFNGAPEALLAAEPNSLRLTGASDCALRLLLCARENLTAYTLCDILAPQDLARLLAAAGAATGPVEVNQCSVRNSAGQASEADLIVHSLPEEPLIVISIRDSAGRNRGPEQLRQAQKMEALGMLSGGIAHDFNNLLTIIAGYSQMLIASPQMTAERDRTAAEQILKASERAAELTSQLLSFSRRQAVQPKILEINHIVDQTAAMLARLIGEHIDLKIHKGADAGRIHADSGHMQQVLINLAINSRDAMPGGGALEIGTSNAELGEEYVSGHLGAKTGSYVMLEVSDTGTGMDAATRERVFEPFFTTKPEGQGTGLGLSTVYGLVRRWGGFIDLRTEAGQGTTFRVYLPRVQEPPSEERTPPTEERGGHETILVVEDEEGVRRMVHMALERRGYRVLVAGGGPEGLDIARRHEGPIDLLISDIVMPQMNGAELARALLPGRPRTLVLLISGYAGDILQNSGTLEKDVPFLQKPFAPATLTHLVRGILDGARTATGAGRG